jgi:hypothetical protein
VRDIPGYEGRYAITKEGRVWSHPKNTVLGSHSGIWLIPKVNRIGYVIVGLRVVEGAKQVWCSVHRLLALTYLPVRVGYPDVNHINGVKSDNLVGNIEWSNGSLNMLHAYRTGLKKPVATTTKLLPGQVSTIRRARQRGVIARVLSEKYGVSTGTIYNIDHGRTFRGGELR